MLFKTNHRYNNAYFILKRLFLIGFDHSKKISSSKFFKIFTKQVMKNAKRRIQI